MRLILIGASGHGKVCAEIAKLSRRYDEIVLLDDDPNVKKCGDYRVIGPSSQFYQFLNEQTEFFVSIGNHEHRQRIQDKIDEAGGVVITLVHPNSVISTDSTIDKGTVVMAGAIINPGTQVGKGTIINTASSVDHDCEIGDYNHVAVGAHICGTVKIGNGCWVGAGAIVKNNVNICNEVIIGAGALVIKDINESGTYIGVPAKKVPVAKI